MAVDVVEHLEAFEVTNGVFDHHSTPGDQPIVGLLFSAQFPALGFAQRQNDLYVAPVILQTDKAQIKHSRVSLIQLIQDVRGTQVGQVMARAGSVSSLMAMNSPVGATTTWFFTVCRFLLPE